MNTKAKGGLDVITTYQVTFSESSESSQEIRGYKTAMNLMKDFGES